MISLVLTPTALSAFLLMYCAGWVHRDISCGNIMALKEAGKWVVKVADLEFAQPFNFSPGTAASDPATVRKEAFSSRCCSTAVTGYAVLYAHRNCK